MIKSQHVLLNPKKKALLPPTQPPTIIMICHELTVWKLKFKKVSTQNNRSVLKNNNNYSINHHIQMMISILWRRKEKALRMN